MALISCPECGNQCSDQAETCPKCGYPFKKKEVKEEFSELEPGDEIVPIPAINPDDDNAPDTMTRLIVTKTKKGYDANVNNLALAGYTKIDRDELHDLWPKVEIPDAKTIYIKRKRVNVAAAIVAFIFGVLPCIIYLIYINSAKPIDVVGIKVEGEEEELEPETTASEPEEKKEE